MLMKASSLYQKFLLDLCNKKVITNLKFKHLPRTVSCAIGMLFMFLFVMSLLIAKVSSTSNFQNQTLAALRTRNGRNFVTPTIVTDTALPTIATTPTITIDTKTKIRKRKLTQLSKSNRSSAASETLTHKSSQSKRSNWKLSSKLYEKKKMHADSTQHTHENLQMHEQKPKIHYRQAQQQQKNYQQEQRPLEEAYEEQKSHRFTSEKAYSVEHVDDDSSVLEQPFYGVWHAKAKRSQASLLQSQKNSAAVAPTQLQPTITIASNDTTTMMTSTTLADLPPPPSHTTLANVSTAEAIVVDGDGQRQNDYHKFHVYERLPHRSSTMSSIRNDPHDQIPRPPRLTSRRPHSLLVRRQYLNHPENTTLSVQRDYDQSPKPFHFPYEGPLPAEFKKVEPERLEVNNIQDILQKLHLGTTPPPSYSTQLYMMPTGLHIAGSFNNLKASGFANLFRSKQKKKSIQLTHPIPVPIPMTMPLPMPIHFYGAFQPHVNPYSFYHNPQQHQYHYSPLHSSQQPYQRIALDQIYHFKPRSPSEVNLLAMQQQQQSKFNANRLPNKNNKKKTKHSHFYDFRNNNGLFMQQTVASQRPEHFMPHYPLPQPPNMTQKPTKLRRIPFKLNLDIYPVLPAAKEPIPLPVRALALASPYSDNVAVRYPIGYSPSVLNPYKHPQYNDQSSIYNALRYRSQPPSSPGATPAQATQVLQSSSNNMQLSVPDQLPKYSQQLQQQQLQQQHYQRPPLESEQNSFQPMACVDSFETEAFDDAAYKSNSNPKSNPIMVHLNVFPKHRKESGQNFPSTNPFYNAEHRHTVAESVGETPNSPTHPRHFPRTIPISSENSTQPQAQLRMTRSDDAFPFFTDFEQPIVASDAKSVAPRISKVSSKTDSSVRASHNDHIAMRNYSAMRAEVDPHLEQISKETNEASLFRFPVEDLILFQVGDAL